MNAQTLFFKLEWHFEALIADSFLLISSLPWLQSKYPTKRLFDGRVWPPSNILSIFHLPIQIKILLLVWSLANIWCPMHTSHVKSLSQIRLFIFFFIILGFLLSSFCLFYLFTFAKMREVMLTIVGKIKLRRTELKM